MDPRSTRINSSISTEEDQYVAQVAAAEEESAKQFKIDEAKKVVETTSKRVKVSSVLLMLFGGASFLCGSWKYLNASHRAHDIVSRGLKGEQQTPMNQTQDSDRFMLRDEFVLYDTFKTVCMIKCFMAMMIACIGCMTFKSWWRRSWNTQWKMKMCRRITFVIIFLGLIVAYQLREIMQIKQKYNPPMRHGGKHWGWSKEGHGHHQDHDQQEEKSFWDEEIQQPLDFFTKETQTDFNTTVLPEPIYLASIEPVLRDDPGCSKVTLQDQCNSGVNCTWCASNQQPPACFLLSESKDLPQKIYQCDKQPQFLQSLAQTEEQGFDRHHGGHHGHKGEHHGGKGHHGHKKCGGCCDMMQALILGVFLIVHYVFQSKQYWALKKHEELTGVENKGWWGCCKPKAKPEAAPAQVATAAPAAPVSPVQVIQVQEPAPLIQKSVIVTQPQTIQRSGVVYSQVPVVEYSINSDRRPTTIPQTTNTMI